MRHTLGERRNLGYSHDADKGVRSRGGFIRTPTLDAYDATETKPTVTTTLFFGLGPKAGHTDCNSEGCGATIRAEWYFRAKKAGREIWRHSCDAAAGFSQRKAGGGVRSRDQEKKMSILLTSKSISVKCPLQSVHCPNRKGLVCVSQKDSRPTLEPLVQPVILSAYED